MIAKVEDLEPEVGPHRLNAVSLRQTGKLVDAPAEAEHSNRLAHEKQPQEGPEAHDDSAFHTWLPSGGWIALQSRVVSRCVTPEPQSTSTLVSSPRISCAGP